MISTLLLLSLARAHALAASPPFMAQIPTPSQTQVGSWAFTFLWVLSVVVLALTAIVQYRKAFGSNPSLSEVIAGLATLEDLAASNGAIKEMEEVLRTRSRGLEEQISGLRHEVRGEHQAIRSGVELRKDQMDERFSILGAELATLRERTESQIRHTISIESKLDRVIEKHLHHS